jgi:hypothetical protein
MLAPPPNGDVASLIPPGMTNPEAWAVVISWDAWRTFAGQALSEGLDDIQYLNGVPI